MRSTPLLLAFLASGCPSGAAPAASDGPQPSDGARQNIVLLLVDDLGWSDLASYGNSFHETPHIDQLAHEGVRFRQAYADAPNCSPSRASILTGRWPARFGLTQYLTGKQPTDKALRPPALPQGLPHAQLTIAEILREAGYATASIGKWHLGGEGYLPTDHGFDINFGGNASGRHQKLFAPYGLPAVPAPAGEYLTDRLTRRALRFIETNADAPFFLYLSYYAVHEPIGGKPEDIEHFEGRARAAAANPANPANPAGAAYAAMLRAVDDSVGQIRAQLASLSLDDHTSILFFSDNGGSEKHTSNRPLRAGKGWLYEGGIRDPLIAFVPGVTRAGQVCETPVTGVDLLPTVLELAQVPAAALDGRSLLPLFSADELPPDRDLFWHYPHYSNSGSTPCGAMRRGDLKLIEFFEDGRTELYDLANDPGEAHDLAATRADEAQELRAALQAWRTSIDARLPIPR
jgi:arylsulfatase A